MEITNIEEVVFWKYDINKLSSNESLRVAADVTLYIKQAESTLYDKVTGACNKTVGEILQLDLGRRGLFRSGGRGGDVEVNIAQMFAVRENVVFSQYNCTLAGDRFAEPAPLGFGGNFDYQDSQLALLAKRFFSGTFTIKITDGAKFLTSVVGGKSKITVSQCFAPETSTVDTIKACVAEGLIMCLNKESEYFNNVPVLDLAETIKYRLNAEDSNITRRGLEIVSLSIETTFADDVKSALAIISKEQMSVNVKTLQAQGRKEDKKYQD